MKRRKGKAASKPWTVVVEDSGVPIDIDLWADAWIAAILELEGDEDADGARQDAGTAQRSDASPPAERESPEGK